jgi:hypothetical protein
VTDGSHQDRIVEARAHLARASAAFEAAAQGLDAEVVAWLDAGATLAEVAAVLRCSRQAVAKRAQRARSRA